MTLEQVGNTLINSGLYVINELSDDKLKAAVIFLFCVIIIILLAIKAPFVFKLIRLAIEILGSDNKKGK
ncbi:hypothetical protein DCO58_12030 [Helicobacter saguini]|uniref:Uncharacterized protein n=1 Tax=Helicobacter saguini TaxID=1548018 RepID=A0A099B888_9HELI|nr:hypothetical protein [Helicobacter saguini]MWV60982.1 hypothetical protein [Helicobacter saguini]MWV68349.1 hypothetical protein [Helicobacter saguini]MWV70186.1 hypothetical protein [Helicobacter saguini]MWV72089.1 hypothetical protein [Helicobacter saguini]TLD93692.1 hypothetical protein LS64_007810 [Helicobacter saguini]